MQDFNNLAVAYSIDLLEASLSSHEKKATKRKSDNIFLSFGIVNYEDRFCLIFETKTITNIDLIIVKLIKSIPNWVKLLLYLRNIIANIFGLKTGEIGNIFDNPETINLKHNQSIGDIFILLKDKYHLIIELKDKHLDFRFSVLICKDKGLTKIYLTTIVKINNFFGKLYFFIITPFHRLIIKNILKNLCNEI